MRDIKKTKQAKDWNANKGEMTEKKCNTNTLILNGETKQKK